MPCGRFCPHLLYLVLVHPIKGQLGQVVTNEDVRGNVKNSRFKDEFEFVVELHASSLRAHGQCLKGLVEDQCFVGWALEMEKMREMRGEVSKK